jgi:uncharacterized membrane protein (UPF0136 family)
MDYMVIVGYGYAVVLLFGAIMGYLRAKSAVSLFAGMGACVVAGVSAYIAPHHPRASEGLAILLAIGMIGLFVSRYLKTKKAMPAMPIIAVSVIVIAATAWHVVAK